MARTLISNAGVKRVQLAHHALLRTGPPLRAFSPDRLGGCRPWRLAAPMSQGGTKR